MTTAANLIILSKKCEFFFNGANVFVPMGDFCVKDLSDKMDSLCGGEVVIQFRTNAKHVDADTKMHTARLSRVGGWEFSGWVNTLSAVWTCVAKRCEGATPTILESLTSKRDAKIAAIRDAESCSGKCNVRRLNRLSDELSEIEAKIEEVSV